MGGRDLPAPWSRCLITSISEDAVPDLPYLAPTPVLSALVLKHGSCKHLLLAQLSWPASQFLLFLAALGTCCLSCSTLNPRASGYVDKICKDFCRFGARWTGWGAPHCPCLIVHFHVFIFVYIHVVYLFRKNRCTPLCLEHIFKTHTHTQTLTLSDQLDRQWTLRKFSLWLPSSQGQKPGLRPPYLLEFFLFQGSTQHWI